MKTILSFKLFTPATPVKSKLNSCQAFAAVTPTDSFSNAAPAPSNFNKSFLPATGDQTFILNSFFVEKSTADAITILAPAHG